LNLELPTQNTKANTFQVYYNEIVDQHIVAVNYSKLFCSI
jgi:hypothetical protein